MTTFNQVFQTIKIMCNSWKPLFNHTDSQIVISWGWFSFINFYLTTINSYFFVLNPRGQWFIRDCPEYYHKR